MLISKTKNLHNSKKTKQNATFSKKEKKSKVLLWRLFTTFEETKLT